MSASIYSINNGTAMAYQFGDSRAIQNRAEVKTATMGWRCEILKDGKWVARSNRWQGIYSKVVAALK